MTKNHSDFMGMKGKSVAGTRYCHVENILPLAGCTIYLAAGILTCENGAVGIVPDAAYLTNVTMFAKTAAGTYKKITLFNAMNEANFSLAAPKSEGEIGLEISAHWDPTDDTTDLYQIEDVAGLAEMLRRQ